nr:SDR family NAD(P)-dependent oxidoreductase [uncultured Fluviicola sp.]
MKIQGKTILITGGASGIGLEAAKQFMTLGAKVIITGRTQLKLDEAKRLYPELITIQSDIANPNENSSLFDQVKEMGGIDILYNNAGVLSPPANLGIADDKHYTIAKYEIDINYLGVIHLNNLFMEMLQSRPESAIINTTSILSYVPSLIESTYSASKVALRFYTEILRAHLKALNSNLKIFELLPPVVSTEMTAARTGKKITPEKLVKALISGIQKDRYTIRVGDTRLIYFFNRFSPKLTFGLVNPKATNQLLKA